jgi:hypothetical protein
LSSWSIRINESQDPSLTALIMSEIVLPGEPVDAKHPNLKLGPGLLQLSDGSIISTKAGTLCHNQNRSKWYVESNSRRVSTKNPIHPSRVYSDLFQYIPSAQESVIGVVVGKNGAEGFRVDIGGPHNANLDALAFEGATKRNRPNLKVVSISYFCPIFADFPRSGLCYMRAFLYPTKIWNRSSNVSMRKPVNQKVTVNSKAGSLLDAA